MKDWCLALARFLSVLQRLLSSGPQPFTQRINTPTHAFNMSTRELRALTNDAASNHFLKRSLEPDAATALGAVVKRQKTRPAPKRYLCSVCNTAKMSRWFPDHNPTSKCEHSIHTCKLCLKQWVHSQIENGACVPQLDTETKRHSLSIRCPEDGCAASMLNADVEDAASLSMCTRFNAIERKHIADNIPGWRWCMNPSCSAGQAHKKCKI